MALARHINQIKKLRDTEYSASRFKSKTEFKLWIEDDLKRCDDLTKLKAHIKTFEDYMVDMAMAKLGMS